MRRQLVPLVAFCALAFAGCDQKPKVAASPPKADSTPAATSMDDRLTELETKLAALDTRVGAVEFNDSMRSEQWSTGYFDPADSRFGRIDSGNGMGSFAVSVEDVRPFGDGVRVKLNLGNLSSGTFQGIHLKMKYGARQPKPGSPNFGAEFVKWQSALQTKEQDVLTPVVPASWNPVQVTLPNIEAAHFGHLEVSLSTNQIQLRK